MADPSKAAVEMMRHCVNHTSRNYYCVEIGGPEWSQWTGLALLGLAREGFKINEQRDQYFHLTAKGREYLAKLAAHHEGQTPEERGK